MASSTAAERKAGIDALAAAFGQHVLTRPGMWLDAATRLQICHAARDAVSSERAECAAIVDPAARAILAPLIRDVVRRDHPLDVHWYKTASATLTDLPTEPRHSSEDNHIIFSEVVLCATISFALTTFYRGIGSPCPPLPAEPLPLADRPAPLALTPQHITTNMRRQERADSFGAPFFLSSDVNPELQSKISKEAWEFATGPLNARQVLKTKLSACRFCLALTLQSGCARDKLPFSSTQSV